jgi:hypothetical protein
VYGRQENFLNQIRSLSNQIIPPKEIIVFIDKHPSKNSDDVIKYCEENNIQSVSVNKNIGVWGRFSIALLSRYNNIFILDDDIVPGKRWFKNCLEELDNRKSVVGGVGVCFNANTFDYNVKYRIGWVNPELNKIHADVVGHCWGAKREFFEKFWRETNNHHKSSKSGEDIHFSRLAQKYNYEIIVPLHGKNPENWANINGVDFGTNDEALSLDPSAILRMSKNLKIAREKGFKYLSEDNNQIRKLKIRLNRGYLHYIKAWILNIYRKLKN